MPPSRPLHRAWNKARAECLRAMPFHVFREASITRRRWQGKSAEAIRADDSPPRFPSDASWISAMSAVRRVPEACRIFCDEDKRSSGIFVVIDRVSPIAAERPDHVAHRKEFPPTIGSKQSSWTIGEPRWTAGRQPVQGEARRRPAGVALRRWRRMELLRVHRSDEAFALRCPTQRRRDL